MQKNSVDIFKHNYSFKLFWSYYVVAAKVILFSPLNLFLGIWLNIFIMLIWLFFKEGDSFILSSVIATVIVRNGMYTYLRALLNNKRTGFNYRMRTVPTSRLFEAIAFVTWNFTYNLVCTFLFIAIGLGFFADQRAIAQNTDWLLFTVSWFILWVSSIIMAYTIYIIVKNPDWAQALGITLYCIAYTFFGCAFPYASVAKLDWLNIILYVFPQRYAINLIQASWVGSHNMRFVSADGYENVDWGFDGKLWLALVIACLVIVLMISIIFSLFLVEENKKNRDRIGLSFINQKSTDVINKLRYAKSIEQLNQIKREAESQRANLIRTYNKDIENISNELKQSIENTSEDF